MTCSCIIVEDEYPARALLHDYVSRLSSLDCQGIFKNPQEALAHLSGHAVDIIFLDIQMPGMTGLDLIRSIRKVPEIILTTAYPQYAVEGFDLSVTDFLVKPFRFERFLEAVNKALKSLQVESEGLKKSEILKVRADQKVHMVPTSEIVYVEGLREYIRIHTIKEKLITLQALKSLEVILPDEFIRIHKSYIVNRKYVDAFSGQEIIIDKVSLPVGRTYRSRILDQLLD